MNQNKKTTFILRFLLFLYLFILRCRPTLQSNSPKPPVCLTVGVSLWSWTVELYTVGILMGLISSYVAELRTKALMLLLIVGSCLSSAPLSAATCSPAVGVSLVEIIELWHWSCGAACQAFFNNFLASTWWPQSHSPCAFIILWVQWY